MKASWRVNGLKGEFNASKSRIRREVAAAVVLISAVIMAVAAALARSGG